MGQINGENQFCRHISSVYRKSNDQSIGIRALDNPTFRLFYGDCAIYVFYLIIYY